MSSLSVGSVNDSRDFGIGHLPLSEATFETWEPAPIQNESVIDDELVGVRMWKEDHAGVW